MAGLTDTGFEIKRLQDIRNDIAKDFQAKFGTDLDVSESSVAGQIISTLSNPLSDLWEGLQATYNSQYPDSADGVSLDRVVAYNALSRLRATNTVVKAIAIGNKGTVIPAGSQARMTDNLTNFISTLEYTIDESKSLIDKINITNVLNSTDYTIIVNGVPYTINSGITATKISIINAFIASMASSIVVTASATNDEYLQIETKDYDTTFSVSLGDNLEFNSIGSPIEFNCSMTGAIEVPANTLTVIVTPISGWDAVTNSLPGITGRNEETDSELRTRRRLSLTKIGSATAEAIKSRIRQEVANITGVFLIENRSDTADIDGRPAHSFETIVAGGDDQEIADKIYQVAPVGIQTYGNIQKNITTSDGQTIPINFSRSVEVYIWLKATITVYNEETFPTHGIDQIKKQIINLSQTQDVGKDVILQKYLSPFYSVPGVGSVNLELAKSSSATVPPSTFSASNIVISSTETAVFADNRLKITVA